MGIYMKRMCHPKNKKKEKKVMSTYRKKNASSEQAK